MACEGQLEAAWDGLDDDVIVFDAVRFQLLDGARDQRVYDGFVPSRVDDGDPEGCAVEGRLGLRKAFD